MIINLSILELVFGELAPDSLLAAERLFITDAYSWSITSEKKIVFLESVRFRKQPALLLELLLLPFFNIGGGGVEECDEGDVEGVYGEWSGAGKILMSLAAQLITTKQRYII